MSRTFMTAVTVCSLIAGSAMAQQTPFGAYVRQHVTSQRRAMPPHSANLTTGA